ncbi:MAG TPA: tripartite tricarboxylate transporter permease [Paracoccus sp. (in: a-proteobacteria)]|uniref:tripartite tricarboxylate transporter permease n=1 Tax=uncultured Paracoccus sp. TaxID=189685 RepID=UPI0026029140|nr:tripartite tricarboxylate transporter permease [uncultured Paracoccus sp.]HMQ40331.1 tripartite tricarboxylate transporter permease [Paracoccus sp. (in: a-proteobacteria)]HMR34900.1 tripartite tricarboxylate transporter permease [Paracoccus sp. (in: a-proteobacteria)]
MSAWEGILYGFGVALQPAVLVYCLLGVTLGTFIGVLPGIGAMAAISLLLPITFYITPEAALIMLAGVYYGAQYGGAVASILLRLPGTPQSAVTTLDGYPMAQQGRAGVALFTSMISSFIGSILGIVVLVVLAGWLSRAATAFGAADYAAMMILGLVAASTIGAERPMKGFAMVVFGMILGCIGTDVNSGAQRFTFGQTELMDGINLVALAMGLFGVAEVIGNIRNAERQAAPEPVSLRQMMPTRDDLRRIPFPALRGTALGSFFGALPGTGSTLSSFLAYAMERRVSRSPERFGKGAVEGVAGPEAANNAAAITAFVPTLTLGIPGDPIMALMLGALVIHGVQPGPLMLEARPEMFWGLVVSFGIGNLLLLILNLPLIGIWVSMLRIPFRYLYPAILIFVCLGVYSVRGASFDIAAVALIGMAGYLLALARFSPALLLLGFVLGPLIETNLRRAMLISRGDPMVFLERPIACGFTIATAALILVSIWQAWRRHVSKAEEGK